MMLAFGLVASAAFFTVSKTGSPRCLLPALLGVTPPFILYQSSGSLTRLGLIGIGGHLATPPLPHHRAYGSVPRRFESLANTRRTRTGGRVISSAHWRALRRGPCS